MAAQRRGLAADYERWDRLELTDDEEEEGITSSAVRDLPCPRGPAARVFCVCMRRTPSRSRPRARLSALSRTGASAGAHCGAAGSLPPGPGCPAGA